MVKQTYIYLQKPPLNSCLCLLWCWVLFLGPQPAEPLPFPKQPPPEAQPDSTEQANTLSEAGSEKRGRVIGMREPQGRALGQKAEMYSKKFFFKNKIYTQPYPKSQ